MKRARATARVVKDPIRERLLKLVNAAIDLTHESLALLNQYTDCQESKLAQSKGRPRAA